MIPCGVDGRRLNTAYLLVERGRRPALRPHHPPPPASTPPPHPSRAAVRQYDGRLAPLIANERRLTQYDLRSLKYPLRILHRNLQENQ